MLHSLFHFLFITEKTSYNVSLDNIKMYYLDQINRKQLSFVYYVIKNSYNSLKIYLKEKPDVVITTGVLATIPICLIMKLFGKKIIYIETFAKSTSATLTGKLMYRFVDQFYVQWESMLEVYPNAIYVGSVF